MGERGGQDKGQGTAHPAGGVGEGQAQRGAPRATVGQQGPVFTAFVEMKMLLIKGAGVEKPIF